MRKLNGFRPDGFWLVVGAAVLWGTIGAATQAIYNLDTASSLFINLGRMAVAAPVLLLACWRVVGRAAFAIPRRDFLLMLLTGTLLALSQAAYFAAIRAAGITIATLLTICVAPVVVTSVSVLLGHERLSGRVVVALVCALAGSALLVGFHAPDEAHTALGLGVIFSLAAAATYAGMIVCGRLLAADYHPLQVTSVSFGAGAVALALVNLAVGLQPTQTPPGWLLIVYLGVAPTALAYWMFQNGLRSVSATAASIIGMLDPLVAALLAWALFGEILTASSLVGAALLLLGIALLSASAPQSAIPDAEPPI